MRPDYMDYYPIYAWLPEGIPTDKKTLGLWVLYCFTCVYAQSALVAVYHNLHKCASKPSVAAQQSNAKASVHILQGQERTKVGLSFILLMIVSALGPNRSTCLIDSRIKLLAVAVAAMQGKLPLATSFKSPIVPCSGRKLFPHFTITCASSATSCWLP